MGLVCAEPGLDDASREATSVSENEPTRRWAEEHNREEAHRTSAFSWFNPNLLNVARRAWSAAMLFEAVIGCGSLNPCRLLADYLLACQPGHRRPCGEWLKRGLRCRKLLCPPRF